MMAPGMIRRGSCDSIVDAGHGGLVDYDAYSGHMLRYYDNTSNDARKTHESRWARHYRKVYNTPGHWLREVALALQDAARGRRVLELACGHCRWTPFMAEVAESVLAVDLAPNMLSWGRQLFHYAAPEARNVDFRLADAYRPDEIEGDFDAGVVINFFQHVPYARHDEFLIMLHAKLGPGATVFIAANHFGPEFCGALFQKGGGRDTYSRRTRPDGTEYDIIDNELDRRTVMMLLEPHARDIRYAKGSAYWWVSYTTR
jgi:SAM-dependent methyltransferase